MSITDEELVRQLESVPLVEPPDFREAVMSQVKSRPSVVKFKRATPRLYLGLAWAAAVAIVIGVAFFRAPEPRPQNAAATMGASDLTVTPNGDRFFVKANVEGTLEWDQTKLTKVETLPDGTVVLRRIPGAKGSAEIRLRAAEGEVLKTSIPVE